MRYRLPTDKLINELVPHYLSGRKFILFLQSLVWPLQMLNDRFVMFAREKRIEAAMTSQMFYFEWYLNRKFGQYLADSTQRICLRDSAPAGVDIYFEGVSPSRPFTVWFEGEQVLATHEGEEPRHMYLRDERKAVGKASFMIHVPAIRISLHEFVHLLSRTVNTYKLAGKTYLIRIEGQELEPNNATP